MFFFNTNDWDWGKRVYTNIHLVYGNFDLPWSGKTQSTLANSTGKLLEWLRKEPGNSCKQNNFKKSGSCLRFP